jgi:hypothetical protein
VPGPLQRRGHRHAEQRILEKKLLVGFEHRQRLLGLGGGDVGKDGFPRLARVIAMHVAEAGQELRR